MWEVDGQVFEDSTDVANYIAKNAEIEYFDDFLNETYEDVEINGKMYAPSEMKTYDPEWYKDEYRQWRNYIKDIIERELNTMSCDRYEFYGFEIMSQN